MKPGLYRGLTSLAVSSAILAGGLIAATAASASTTPPWEPDPSAVGTVTFYDANGNQITSGSTDVAPFAAYAVGSATVRSGDPQAQAVFANPDPSSSTPHWYKEQVGLYSRLPLTSGPANIKTLSQSKPVVAGGPDDQTLDGFESDSTISTAAGYQNVVQVRIRTANSATQPTASYDSADLLIDPSTHTWQEIYPAAVTISPPGAPTALQATAGDAAATVSWTAPASDGGTAITGYTLQYSSNGGTTWTGTPHSGTSTSQVVSGLTNGTAYVFRVAAVNSAGSSDFTPASTAVTPQADATALAIGVAGAVNYNAVNTYSTKLTDTRTGAGVAGQSVVLYRRASATKPWALVKQLTTSATGTASVATAATANAQYQWRYAGNALYLSSTSAIAGQSVAQTLSVHVTASSVKRGTNDQFYGTVKPVGTGQRVYLQELVKGVWHTTSVSTIIKNQRFPNHSTGIGYLITAKLGTKGAFRFRIYVPATSTLAAGGSASFVVTVK